jgi:hypothetical protein
MMNAKSSFRVIINISPRGWLSDRISKKVTCFNENKNIPQNQPKGKYWVCPVFHSDYLIFMRRDYDSTYLITK